MKKTFPTIIKLVSLVVLCSCATLPHAVVPTTNTIQITTRSIELPNSSNLELKLNGTQYDIPYEISTYLIDPQQMQICIIAKEPKKPATGPIYLILYDLNKKEVVWSKKTYATQATFTDDKLIITGVKTSYKSFGLERTSGDVKWTKDVFWYYPLKNHIAFTGLITAFDLNTGQDLWSRKIKNEYGWIERIVIDEDMIAAVDGIHKFNLKTGEGWSKELPTGKLDQAKAVGMNILSGIAGGGYVAPEKITGLASNILKKEDHIYFSAMDDLNCFDYNSGKEIWHVQLNQKKTGDSYLFSHEDNLIIINKGSSYRNGVYQKYGQPYLAIFDMNTGQQISWTELTVESPIKDLLKVENDGFYLLTDDCILFYDFLGKLKCKSVTSSDHTKKTKKNIAFAGSQSYFALIDGKDNHYQSLKTLKKDSNEFIVRSTDGLSFYDEQCISTKFLSNDNVKQLFAVSEEYYFSSGDLSYVYVPKKTVEYSMNIISHDGRLIGDYLLPDKARNSKKVFSADSTKTFLFYINNDNKSFVICPLYDLNIK